MPSPPHPTEALRITLHGDEMVEAAAQAARAVGVGAGLELADADRLASAVDATCRLAIELGFDDPADAEVTVVVLEGPTGLAVRITDEGLPFTLATEGDESALAARVAQATGLGVASVVDHIAVDHRDEGTTIELHVRPDPSVLEHLASAGDVGTDPVPDDVEITYRPLERADCESLARCVWRVYRYTYVADYLYHPDRVWSLVEQGWLRSWVAVDPDGEVVAHIGLVIEEPGTRLGDATLALTDPRYRHHHLMEGVGALMFGALAESDLLGTFAEAVTTHTITQRGSVRTGAIETGILLGFIPATMSYRGIAEDLGGNRQSAVLNYHLRREAPSRTVALPLRYADELREKLAAGGLDRAEVPPAPAEPDTTTEARVELDPPRHLATIIVTRAGADMVEVVDRHRRDLCAAGTEIVYAELPLGDPAAADAVDDLVARGFFYGGVLPERRDGDVLRLQYLDVDVDPSVIQLYSDEARRLLDLTLADRG